MERFNNNSTAKDRQVVMIKYEEIIISLRVASFLVSLLNVTVLANSKFKDSLYRYLLVIAIVDSLYLCVILFLGVMKAMSLQSQCGPGFYYAFLVLFILLSDFLTSALALLNILLEIFLTLQRNVIISNRETWLKNVPVSKTCSVSFLISIGCYFPVLFMKKVELTEIRAVENNATPIFDYRMVKSEFGKSKFAAVFQIAINALRIVLVCGVLLVLNLAVTRKFRAYLKKKNTLKDIKCKSFFFKQKFDAQ
jgi:hypothetical protein